MVPFELSFLAWWIKWMNGADVRGDVIDGFYHVNVSIFQ